ncbi:hypothetical protein MRX96_024157 [Rhipicephalus microplus]
MASPGQPTPAVSRKLAEAAGRCHALPFVPPGMRALAHSLVTPSLECTVDLSPLHDKEDLGHRDHGAVEASVKGEGSHLFGDRFR